MSSPVLDIIQRKRGVRGRAEGSGHLEPNLFGGGVAGAVGVQGGEQVLRADGKGDGSGDYGAVGQGAALAGEIDILPGQADGAGAGAITAGYLAKCVESRRDSWHVDNHLNGSGGCLQVVDNGRAKIKRTRKPICYARSSSGRRPGVHVVSVAAVRAVLVAVDWGIDVGRPAAVPASVTGKAWARVFERWGVVAFERPLDAPELLASGECAWSPGGGFPATIRRGG